MPTLLHTADWHLGKRLRDFRLIDEQRAALARLLAVVDAERPDLVVVAGDVFDVPVPPLEALEAWDWVVGELVEARGVPLVAIPGNHDHGVRLAQNARVARGAGLHVRSALEGAHEPLRVAGVDVFAVPFHKPPHVRALAARAGDELDLDDFDYDAAMAWLLGRAARDPFVPAVLVAHAFVAGGGEEGVGEDPVMVGGAGAVQPATLAAFDYVALGHLHAPRALPDHPHVRYAGGLYPYAFDDAGPKSVALVDVAPGAPARVRTAALDVERRVRVWEGVGFDEALAAGRAARAAGDRSVDDYLLLRVADRGPLAHAIDRLREVYPHALLEQPVVDVATAARAAPLDVRTADPEALFLTFFAEVVGEPLTELERAVLREALAADAEEAA